MTNVEQIMTKTELAVKFMYEDLAIDFTANIDSMLSEMREVVAQHPDNGLPSHARLEQSISAMLNLKPAADATIAAIARAIAPIYDEYSNSDGFVLMAIDAVDQLERYTWTPVRVHKFQFIFPQPNQPIVKDGQHYAVPTLYYDVAVEGPGISEFRHEYFELFDEEALLTSVESSDYEVCND